MAEWVVKMCVTLITRSSMQALERRQTGAERELHSQLRVFARYHSAAEHAQLVDGLLLEQRLRARLEVSLPATHLGPYFSLSREPLPCCLAVAASYDRQS